MGQFRNDLPSESSPLLERLRAGDRRALVNSLDPLDREIVALRHFEQLSRAETAEVLGITEEVGAKR